MKGIVLINLGSPKNLELSSVKRYLRYSKINSKDFGEFYYCSFSLIKNKKGI